MTVHRGGDREPWAVYQPSPETPWNLRRVVHLHRRAAFAATTAEVERDLKDGPGPSINRLLTGRATCPTPGADFESIAATIAGAAAQSRQPERLQAWWVLRMLAGPDPLRERMTLMWHNHFATSNHKVQDLAAMRRQNDLFRDLALAPFGDLLGAAVRDPALLVWLDAPANRASHPNENLARELLELFTLGIGHYFENDVKEAARALTGWTVVDGKFTENPDGHDAGTKVILGERGPWNGPTLIRRLLDQPATAIRLAWRLCELLMGEAIVDLQAIESLAHGLAAHELDLGWGVATILRSRAFFSTANLGTRVLGPAEFVIGAARALGCSPGAPGPLELAGWIERIGQSLFHPPNVGGWAGGRAWLSARGLIARARFAAALVKGGQPGLDAPVDVLKLARERGADRDLRNVVQALAELLLGYQPSPAWHDRIIAASTRASAPLATAAQTAAALVLSSTEAQLG